MMKTTLEIPDRIFRRAKSKAAEQGIPFRQFVIEAVENRLNMAAVPGTKPWLKHAGKLKHLHKDTEQINQVIDETFEQIDTENWR